MDETKIQGREVPNAANPTQSTATPKGWIGNRIWTDELAAAYADYIKAPIEAERDKLKAELAKRKRKIYKFPEAPIMCEECDGTSFITCGGQDLICYTCYLLDSIATYEAELATSQARVKELERGTIPAECNCLQAWAASIPKPPCPVHSGVTNLRR